MCIRDSDPTVPIAETYSKLNSHEKICQPLRVWTKPSCPKCKKTFCTIGNYDSHSKVCKVVESSEEPAKDETVDFEAVDPEDMDHGDVKTSGIH